MVIYRERYPDYEVRLTQKIPWGYAIIAMGYIVFWASLRTAFVDTAGYINRFNSVPTGIGEAFKVFTTNVKDKGWDFIEIIFKTCISDNYHFWFTFIAIATAIPILVVYRNRSCNFLFSMFLFVCSLTYIWMFNGIRQFLVAAILLGFGYLIENKKFYKFLIVLILCASIHGTAWIMLPIYFFITDKPFGRRINIFIIAVLACTFAISPLIETMETLLENTYYQNNLKEFSEDDGVHPLRVLLNSIPLLLVIIRRRQILATDNKYIFMCINMSVMSVGLYFVGMLTSGIMVGRLPIYFTMYDFILYPYLLNYIYSDKKTLLTLGISLIYLVFYYLMTENIYYISDILGTYV